METSDIAVIAVVAGVGYVLFKDQIGGILGGTSKAMDGIGSGVNTVSNEVGEQFAAALNPSQALSRRLTEFIDNYGKPQPTTTTNVFLTPEQFNKTTRASGISTMATTQEDIKNIGGTYYSPLFNGGSYTPSASSTTTAVTTATKGGNTSSRVRSPTYSNKGTFVPKEKSIAFKMGLIK